MLFLLWCILFVLCWPVALVVLVILPFFWLMLLPFWLIGIVFRLFGLIVRAMFALIETILFLPARLLGWRSHA